MKARWQFRFYPTPVQASELERVFGACRYVYNRMLRERTDAWHTEQRSIGYNESSAMLTQWKRDEATEWLNEVSSVPTQQALRHLQSAFTNFFNQTARYPSFRKKHDRQSAEYSRSGFRLRLDDPNNPSILVAGLGRLHIHWSRKLEITPTTVTITKNRSGRYFVSLCLETEIMKLPKTGQSIGVDLGVNRLATLSNGDRIANPKHLGRRLRRLALLQRRLAKSQKGSKRRERIRKAVAKLHEHIGNSRKDAIDKATTSLVKRFDVIHMEDLNIRGMMANHKLARSIGDAGMGMFARMMDYKCAWYGKELVKIDPFYPSSKRCNCCGHVLAQLPLNVRAWQCPECGASHDRDHNAALNIATAQGHCVEVRGEPVRRLRAKVRNRSVQRSANPHEGKPVGVC